MKSIVMMGATGAVGGQTLNALLDNSKVEKLTLLGRRDIQSITSTKVVQHQIDIHKSDSYTPFLVNHEVAICTLGVGQPSKVSKEDFSKIDKVAVYEFAKACKNAGVSHFELLSSVGINEKSSSFYLRSKGELVKEIEALGFDRFSIFQPSMILTPNNRYGLSQAVTLKIWPLLKPLLQGGLRQYRGVQVEVLGKAIATNVFNEKSGVEYLKWDDFNEVIDSNTQL